MRRQDHWHSQKVLSHPGDVGWLFIRSRTDSGITFQHFLDRKAQFQLTDKRTDAAMNAGTRSDMRIGATIEEVRVRILEFRRVAVGRRVSNQSLVARAETRSPEFGIAGDFAP